MSDEFNRQCRSCGGSCGGGYHYLNKNGKRRYKLCRQLPKPDIVEQRKAVATIGRSG